MTTQLAHLYLALRDLFEPLIERLSTLERVEFLFERYGWRVSLDDAAFAQIDAALDVKARLVHFLDVADAVQARLDADPEASLEAQDLVSLGGAIEPLIAALVDFTPNRLTDLPEPLGTGEFWTSIAEHLLDDQAEAFLRLYHPHLYLVLHTGGVLRYVPTAPAGAHRQAYTRTLFDWPQLLGLATDPLTALKQVYHWGDAQTPFDHRALLAALARVLEAIGVPGAAIAPSLQRLPLPDAPAPRPQANADALRATILHGFSPHDHIVYEAGLELLPALKGTQTAASGLMLRPVLRGGAQGELPLGDRTVLRWQTNADAGQAFGVVAFPDGVDLVGGDVALESSLELTRTDSEPMRVFGTPRTARLELRQPSLRLSVQGSVGDPEARLRVGAGAPGGEPGCRLIVPLDEADEFVKQSVESSSLDLAFSPEILWSSKTGLSFNGKPTLEIDLPMDRSVGAVRVQRLLVRVAPSPDQPGTVLQAEASAGFGLRLGPVSASVDRLGVLLEMDFTKRPRNLGFADLAFRFKPPSGVGLAIDAGGLVSGGGFLAHDPVQQQYSGVMQLSLRDQLTLKAFGLVATRMPDGSRGFSMLIFITAEDFKPVPLGLGFMLQGIGGMIAVNRSFDEDVLRAGLKNDTLGTLMFPRDPVGNAPALLQALASAFPARRGSYLLGLLARIGWLTPALVQLDLALILEFGARSRLLALGRVSSLLPTRDNDLVRLNLDAIGVLDFDEGTAAIDAVLVDSRLAHQYAITGAAALRARWSSGPGSGFVLAVGGFNPRFAPPAGMPALERVAISLSSGDNPRLRCEAYFAITSNTLQFGARAQLYAAAAGFSVEGDVGFDVLMQRSPLHFIADFLAQVQLKRGSHNLFKVKLEGELEGPRPLRASGKASFEILWCDFSVRFDKTLIDGEAPPLPPAVDVLAELQRALASPQSWGTRLAPGHTHGVALRALPPGDTLVLDPLGQLVVKQQVVPLNTGRDVDTFGGAPVAGARRFQLSATLNGQATSTLATVSEPFAPAQFFSMSDDEKLGSPSFEAMDAGLVFGDDTARFDAGEVVAAPLQYDASVVNVLAPDGSEQRPPEPASPPRYVLGADRLREMSSEGSAARAALRQAGAARFRNPAAAPAARLSPLQWRLVPLGGGAPAAPDPSLRTCSDLHAALATLNRGGARWQMVPTHELTD